MEENGFSQECLTEEEAFWVMFYFLDGRYGVSGDSYRLSDVLSASQPFEFNDNGHIDGEVHGNRKVAPADSAMIVYWNEAVRKFREQGRPGPEQLVK